VVVAVAAGVVEPAGKTSGFPFFGIWV
jgi:hypothetical protein